MPELAETLILARQLAHHYGLPLRTDALPRYWDCGSITGPSVGRELKIQQVGDNPCLKIGEVQGTLTTVSHRGKKIYLHLAQVEMKMIEIEIRLGMTGSFSLVQSPYSRVCLQSPVNSVWFNDIRKFGGFFPRKEYPAPSVTSSLKLDLSVLTNPRLTVKEAIQNQNLLFSGVGNYLANESLYRAMIHPLTPAVKLNELQWGRLLLAIRHLVRDSLCASGCTLKDFQDLHGMTGSFQHQLLVYGKISCPSCKTSLTVIRGKLPTSWVCEKCQPLNRSVVE